MAAKPLSFNYYSKNTKYAENLKWAERRCCPDVAAFWAGFLVSFAFLFLEISCKIQEEAKYGRNYKFSCNSVAKAIKLAWKSKV